MSTLPQAKQQVKIPEPVRRETVVMGRQGFFSVVFRLIGVELYKLRRRTMSRVMSVIAIISVLLVFTLIGVSSALVASSPTSAYMHGEVGTVSEAQAAQARQDTLMNISTLLRLPDSLFATVQIIDTVGLILIIILAGTIVGGEYGVGTVRLMFTRGPTRTQFMLAKLGAILCCSALGVVVLVPLGIIVGALFNLVTGIGLDMHFFNGGWLLHAFLYMLVTVLNLFMYATIAVCLATLGRTTAAGVAGTIIWWIVESVLSGLLTLVGSFNQGVLGNLLKAIPDYFISNNLSALVQNQHQYLLGESVPAGQISDIHALLVLVVYLLALGGLAWWVNEKRDVTN